MHAESEVRIPLVTGGKTVHDVSEDIAGRVEERPSITWMLAMAVSLAQKEEEINQKNRITTNTKMSIRTESYNKILQTRYPSVFSH